MEKIPRELKMKKPVIFLDFDDVICLNQRYGGYDILEAYSCVARSGTPIDVEDELWREIFDISAKRNLLQIHEKFSPQYVLSTSWRWFFDRNMLEQTLKMTELGFVAANLHEDWSTPLITRGAHRAAEISRWLSSHPESEASWAVLDDKLSGTGFFAWPHDRRKFVVLCHEGIGFQENELRLLNQLLTLRVNSSNN